MKKYKLLIFVAAIIILSSSVLFSTDIWQNCGLPIKTQVNCITFSDTVLIIGTSNGIYRNTYAYVNNFVWQEINNGLPTKKIIALAATYPSNICAATDSGIFISSNIGTDWVKPKTPPIANNIYCLTIDYEEYIYAATDNGLFYSTDRGNNWKQLGLSGKKIISLAVGYNSNDIFAGISQDTTGMYLTTNFGKTWQYNIFGYYNSLSITAFGLFAGIETHNISESSVRHSTDVGKTWMQNGLGNCSVKCFASGFGKNIFAGIDTSGIWEGVESYKGVQFSSDAGTSWQDWNEGLTDQNIFTLFNLRNVLLAGNSSGLFWRVQPAISSAPNNSAFTTLLAISPNPINRGELLKISPNESYKYNIKIIDMQGDVIYEANSFNSVPSLINTSLLSSGVYMAILSSEGKIETKRFVVLR